jgi:uncharacterized MAPEG superfamily protein
MQRAKEAHSNAIENLAPFLAIFVGATSFGMELDSNMLTTPVMVFFVCRVLHFPAQVSNILLARTLFFFGDTGATLYMAYFSAMTRLPGIALLLILVGAYTKVLFGAYILPLLVTNKWTKWMLRAKAAHYNAIENLTPFVAIITALAPKISFAESELYTTIGITFVVSRMLHFPAQISNVPLARTLAFFGNTGAALAIVYLALMA